MLECSSILEYALQAAAGHEKELVNLYIWSSEPYVYRPLLEAALDVVGCSYIDSTYDSSYFIGSGADSGLRHKNRPDRPVLSCHLLSIIYFLFACCCFLIMLYVKYLLFWASGPSFYASIVCMYNGIYNWMR
jgi:hypothetical protein